METAAGPAARPAVIRGIATLFVVLLMLAGGCQQQPGGGMPTVKMHIGTKTFVLEVARTPDQQEKGLMERDSLAADHGMIFVFDHDEVQNFWMKNTRFPLDIIFCDARGKVVSVRQMKAYDLTNTSSDYPARYAIELNKGAAAAAGVKEGDVLEIPPAARSSAVPPTSAPA